MRRPSPYVPLSVHYADDEKIMAVGEDAELMYLRMLAYAGRTPGTNGWVSEAVAMSRLGISERPGVPDSDPRSRAQLLEDHGLIEREGTGWRLRAWLRWNRSSDQIEREREQDRARKEAAKNGSSTGNVTGNVTGNDAGKKGGFRQADTDTEAEADTDSCASDDARETDHLDRFEEFWDVYAKKTGKQATQQKWRLALKKKGVTPDVLIDAARAYVGELKAEGKHPQFTKDPARWLNGEHWNDELIANVAPIHRDRPRRNGLAFVPTCPTCAAPPEDVHDPDCPNQSWTPPKEGAQS